MNQKGLRYAAWLDPDAKTASTAQAIMDDLLRRFNGPRFAPHLTLTSGLKGDEDEVCERFASLASSLSPQQAIPGDIVTGGSVFRAVMLTCEVGDDLWDLRHTVRQEWNLPEVNWKPHLSLFYGELSQDEEVAIQAELAGQHWDAFSITGCSLWRLPGDDPDEWTQVDQISWYPEKIPG